MMFKIKGEQTICNLPSAALVTASSGTLSSLNLATDRLMGRPFAMEKVVQADVAAGIAANRNAVNFILNNLSIGRKMR